MPGSSLPWAHLTQPLPTPYPHRMLRVPIWTEDIQGGSCPGDRPANSLLAQCLAPLPAPLWSWPCPALAGEQGRLVLPPSWTPGLWAHTPWGGTQERNEAKCWWAGWSGPCTHHTHLRVGLALQRQEGNLVRLWERGQEGGCRRGNVAGPTPAGGPWRLWQQPSPGTRSGNSRPVSVGDKPSVCWWLLLNSTQSFSPAQLPFLA